MAIIERPKITPLRIPARLVLPPRRDDSGQTGQKGDEQESPDALAVTLGGRLAVGCGCDAFLDRGGRRVDGDGYLLLVEGALQSVAGLELHPALECEWFFCQRFDNLSETGCSLEVVNIHAEALVELLVRCLHVL